jgi:hypothetical protein
MSRVVEGAVTSEVFLGVRIEGRSLEDVAAPGRDSVRVLDSS